MRIGKICTKGLFRSGLLRRYTPRNDEVKDVWKTRRLVMFRLFIFVLSFLFSFVPISHAQNDNIDVQGILAIAKMTGSCGK